MVNPFKSLMSWFSSARQQKADPGYGVAIQFTGPGQPVWSNKDYAAFVREGYRRNGTVYNCINKIAGAAAGIRWRLYTDKSMRREIAEHPLLDLWARPNTRHIGTGLFVEQVFGYWHMSGNSYIFANREAENAPPDELWPLRPDMMKIVPGEHAIEGYVYGYGTSNVRSLDAADVLHLKFPAYDDDWYGLSPIEVASNLIDQQNEGNAWNISLMQNAGKSAGALFAKGFLTVEQRNQIKQELRRTYSGKRNAGLPLVFEGDMTWQNMSLTPYELDWLQSRELNTRDIAAIFDVAPELVGDSAGKTFANQKEAKQALYTENVLPKMDRFRDALNAWLVPMYDDLQHMGAWFTYDKSDIEVLQELYQAARAAESMRITNLWNSGQIMLRDAQALQGLPVDQNATVYKIGAILVPAEQIAAYAEQSLQHPSAPPTPTPENEPMPPGGPTGPVVDAAPAKMLSARRQIKALDLTTKAEKQAYHQRMEDARAIWETQAEEKLADYFREEHKAVINAVRNNGSIEMALQAKQDELKDILFSIYTGVVGDIGSQVAKEIEGAKALTNLLTAGTIAYLLQLSGQKVQQISATTLASLQQAMADGVAEGESIPQIAARIDQLYVQQIVPNRSTLIARTEVVAASNYAAMQAGRASGLTLNKVWLATSDARTRRDHADADGQEVGMDEPFEVGGYQMMQPGDSSAPPSEVCNCRCTVYFKRVKQPAQQVGEIDTPDNDAADDTATEQASRVPVVSARRSYRNEYQAFMGRFS